MDLEENEKEILQLSLHIKSLIDDYGGQKQWSDLYKLKSSILNLTEGYMYHDGNIKNVQAVMLIHQVIKLISKDVDNASDFINIKLRKHKLKKILDFLD